MDRTPELLATLAPYVQYQTARFISRLRDQHQLPAVITSALRTPAEQRRLLQQRRTTTLRSKHLEGLAFDVDMYGWGRDAVPEWVWAEIGPVGESLGMIWGGRWVGFRDVGHFQWGN